MNATQATHPFEAAGLGLAPFRYVGIESQNVNQAGNRIVGSHAGISVETKVGGTCAFCGMAIKNLYGVQSSDGKRFHVGSDCVRKTADALLIARVERDEKAMKAEQKKAADARKIAEGIAALDAARPALALMPHPTPVMAAKGMKKLDWVEWMMENAGTAGKVAAARSIINAIK